ncbi:Sec-independent protein translocase protein TatB [Altererythrobacter arenosus]|uniref:Sec-independent protein translocase protein TatB n=1 Tax=Altererythrobacter arenosus TaxID=3032592 RepID=A0ABY8FXA9_9SPHN|nr:Sec-independent protein translocase protein TatB [Altererythrobacter sp. CAU 1644]WFL78031.1 Sec-independent protein translocase protein TatB [Altererythrobacter sp. CAU 1644]
MFDIGASELLVIVIVAVLVIGPKDMPMALRTAGRWIGKVRRVSSHFRTGIDAMIREAELEDMEKKWKAQNEQIMARTPAADGTGLPADEPAMTGPPVEGDAQAASAESRLPSIEHDPDTDDPAPASKAGSNAKGDSEPELPLGTSAPKS